MERLQKVLAHAGVAARRKCEEIILAGRVRVNGQVVTELGTKVDPDHDEILVDNQPILREKPVYLLLFKPRGVVTTVSDPEGRKTVIDLLPDIKQRVYPVGRLDLDTSGLLLLTNDGELSNGLMHPSHEIRKVYRVSIRGQMDEKAVQTLRDGVMLEDGMTAPAKVEILKREPQSTLVEITIHEGRNRQVRRMCDEVGHPVQTLKRVKLAFLTLGHLQPREYRHLYEDEVQRLYRLAGIE